MGHENSLRGDDGEFITKEWEVVRVIGGVSVLHNPYQKNEFDLPIKANSSECYFKQDKDGNITQLRVYDSNHNAMFDIDINPKKPHDNLKAGVTHIHEFTEIDGKIVRAKKKARYLTESEIKKWNPLLSLARGDVRYYE